MSRYSRYDTDEERLPEGMTRVGYDADTQVYTFQDADGSYWESAPGNQYGQLTRVSGGDGHDADDNEPFLPGGDASGPTTSWRHDMMPLLNFGVLIGLFLLVLFWWMHYATSSKSEHSEPVVSCPEGTSAYAIQGGDTCWAIAYQSGSTVDQLLLDNPGLDCDKLAVGSRICVPEK
jgi:hypothetical protein